MYRGPRFVWIVLVVLASVSTARSLVHIFVPDGGSSSIAGIALAPNAAGPLVYASAWAGVYQLLWASAE